LLRNISSSFIDNLQGAVEFITYAVARIEETRAPSRCEEVSPKYVGAIINE